MLRPPRHCDFTVHGYAICRRPSTARRRAFGCVKRGRFEAAVDSARGDVLQFPLRPALEGGFQPMPMAANDIERLIKARIPDAAVTIRDLAGDGDHYAATVIAESFRGKSRVQQHQLVYNALKGQMGGALHALALQTGLPEA